MPHFGGGLHSQSLDCYWQTDNKERIEYKSQKYTQVGLFYNGPEHHTGRASLCSAIPLWVQTWHKPGLWVTNRWLWHSCVRWYGHIAKTLTNHHYVMLNNCQNRNLSSCDAIQLLFPDEFCNIQKTPKATAVRAYSAAQDMVAGREIRG